MRLTAEELQRDIEMLRHGGSDATGLFLEISAKLYDRGGEQALQSWVTVAAPALTEQARCDLVASLLGELFRVYDEHGVPLPETPPPTLN